MSKSDFYAIDLFAGCGGLSEGFIQAGFNVIGEIESDRWACETLRTRHTAYHLKKLKKSYIYHMIMKEQIDKDEIFRRYDDIAESVSLSVIEEAFEKIDEPVIKNKIEMSRKFHRAPKFHVLLGGPPCQPYSIVGRARDPERKENDERHFLYKYYIDILEALEPDFFVYENVPGLFTARVKGEKILERILNDFSLLHPSYQIMPSLEQIYKDPGSYVLNAADFLVPQRRKRLILIGYKKSLDRYNKDIINLFKNIQERGKINREKGYLTVDDAIGDLNPLKPGEGSDGWLGEYHLNSGLKKYQVEMRNNSIGVMNHKARNHMESDLERYKFFIEYYDKYDKEPNLNTLKMKRPDLLPAHRHLDKFIDRFKVQWWNNPASTITAHISKDGHHYIHPDLSQCRTFTVREAARCQSFPDDFKFEGPRTEQFKQVGNAVPPRLARFIGQSIMDELIKIYGNQR